MVCIAEWYVLGLEPVFTREEGDEDRPAILPMVRPG
jgi:hypothetical protein